MRYLQSRRLWLGLVVGISLLFALYLAYRSSMIKVPAYPHADHIQYYRIGADPLANRPLHLTFTTADPTPAIKASYRRYFDAQQWKLDEDSETRLVFHDAPERLHDPAFTEVFIYFLPDDEQTRVEIYYYTLPGASFEL
jgi:hypothetical protein